MTKVFFINGLPRAGKDTFVGMVSAILEQCGVPVGTFSSIDPVRDMLSSAGFDLSQKTEADRKLLSIVGAAVEEHSNWRTKLTVDFVTGFEAAFPTNAHFDVGGGVVFLHVREAENIKAIATELWKNGIMSETILVKSLRSEEPKSDADRDVLNTEYDIEVENNGTLIDLMKKAVRFSFRNCDLKGSAYV